jgi:hypothetical protein
MPRKTFMIAALMIVSGSVPARAGDGAAACAKWSHEFYEASKSNTTFDACFELYPREMSAQIRADVNGVGASKRKTSDLVGVPPPGFNEEKK